MTKTTNAIATALVLLLVLVGCEAPLVLEHVEAQAQQPTQRSDQLQAVASNDNAVVVVGNRGVVLTSSDGGSTWQRQVLDGLPFLMDVAVCPDGQFAALAGEQQVWIGSADGQSWQPSDIETYEALQALTCDPSGRLWVVASFSTIYRSDDTGETWSETSLDEDLHFTTVQFIDKEFAYLTGEFGTVARTIDGGETWEMLTPIEGEFYPQDAWFADRNTGWVVGLTGTVLRTDDGGESWVAEPTGTEAPLYGIARSNGSLVVVGGYGTVLKRSTDGRWNRLEHGKPIRFYLRGAQALNNGDIVTAGGAGALFVLES